ncbi:hypothetical protein LDENG_00108450, partial [Lucifuga dentata]
MEEKNFYGDGEAEFQSWVNGQPNSDGGDNQYCVAFNFKGKWDDTSCENLLPFLCYNAKAATSYILVTEEKKWTAAQTYCRKYYTDLISIRNKEENEEVQSLLQTSDIQQAWIGLYRDPWAFWSDNSTSTFTNWYSNEPNNAKNKQFCGYFSTITGQWGDTSCENIVPFFCYK